MDRRKVVIVGGTRPEWIKLVSTIKTLEESKLDVVIVNTGQHADLADTILKEFNIKPKYNLTVFGGSIAEMSAEIISKMDLIYKRERPDLVLVQGDTCSTFAGAYSAFVNKIPIVHLEAGARSGSIKEPYPEEGMRLMVDSISDYYLCQDEYHAGFLIDEQKHSEQFIVGNTALDALKLLDLKTDKKKKILITMHRRENWSKVEELNKIILYLSHMFTDYKFKFVVHPNPLLSRKVHDYFKDSKHVEVVNHLGYKEFAQELSEASIVMTDSGGVSQEAPTLKTPVIMLRDVCENEELINTNVAVLTGIDEKKIIREVEKLIMNPFYYDSRLGRNPYGDGDSYKKIIKVLEEILK